MKATTTTTQRHGLVPRNSDDQEIPRFTWWPHKGSTEWIQLEFPKSREVSKVKVYWFDNTGHGGCRIPKSWQVVYLDGSRLEAGGRPQDRAGREGPLQRDKLHSSSGRRLCASRCSSSPSMSGGVLECRPFQHAILCIIMREGNGLRSFLSTRQGCVLPYVLVRAPAPASMLAPMLVVPSLSTDSRNFLLSRHST